MVVFEPAVASHAFGQHRFALVTKRRMAQVVRKRDRLGQIRVQPERAGDVARDGGDFDRMRQPRAQMVAGAVEKNLRLVFEAAEGARMDDAVAVALKFGAIGVTRFTVQPAARFARFLSNRRERYTLPFLHLFARLPFCAHVSLNCRGAWRLRLHPLDGSAFLIICRFTYEKTRNEKAYPRTPPAVRVRLCAAIDHQRGSEQQSF